MSAIAAERRQTRAPRASPWRVLLPSLAAAALAICAVVLWRQDTNLRRQLASLEENISRQQEQLRSANEVLATLTDPAAARFTLSAANTPPRPQGKAIYARNRGSLIFLATNMQALPPQKAYELWLIPTTGAPIPAGVFKPDANGSAAVINPPLPGNVEAKTFAITVEPEAGSPAPTSQIIMVGTGG
jgi:anti-sigma-K factor RskA